MEKDKRFISTLLVVVVGRVAIFGKLFFGRFSEHNCWFFLAFVLLVPLQDSSFFLFIVINFIMSHLAPEDKVNMSLGEQSVPFYNWIDFKSCFYLDFIG